MTINEIKTEIRKIEKYYDFNRQTNHYDVLVNLTEIANLILLQNKISYNKAINNFAEKLKPIIDEKIKGWTNSDDLRRWCERSIDEIAEQLKAGAENENYNKEES